MTVDRPEPRSVAASAAVPVTGRVGVAVSTIPGVDELVALYAEGDLAGRVVGAAPRSQVRARNLPHAATAVLVRDGSGRVYVHRRTETKDIYPGCHDVWAGGVVLAGEDPDQAAQRELAEELGVRGCPLTPVLRYWYADEATSYLAFVYEARYDPDRDGPIVHQPAEVAAGWWLDWDELLTRLADPTWPFVPDGRATLHRYLALGHPS
ncbi:MAG: NUDIX domain-containing protein [Micromonosporaceae bacterium]|nr:NUDIX domain-containing protein [Micromonosporaceae bacterium]